MNDLAERALTELTAARDRVRDHPLLTLGVAGFVVASVAVVAGARVSATGPTRPLTSWLGLVDVSAPAAVNTVAAAVFAITVAVLVLLWVVAVQLLRRGRQPAGRVAVTAAAWALPFAVGPPLLGTSVYTYAAYGLVQRAGHDPYHTPPSGLGASRVVLAIDPGARDVTSAAGPLGTLIQHLAVSVGAGSALGAVLVLRLVSVLAVAWIGRLAGDMGGALRGRALALCVFNPLVLLYLVSAARLDALMIAFVLAAIVTANQRRWLTSIAAACLAGSVCPQGFVAVPIVLAVHWFGRRHRPPGRVVATDVLAAAAVICALGFAVPGGFGWLRTVTDQFTAHPPFAVASVISRMFEPVVRGASVDDLAAGSRITVVTAAVCVVGYLLGTARSRALERTMGYAFLAVGLLAPVLYPWYVLWGTLVFAPTAHGWRRRMVLVLCGSACLLELPGWSQVAGNLISGAALLAGGLTLAVWYLLDRRRAAQGEEISRTAGRTSAR